VVDADAQTRGQRQFCSTGCRDIFTTFESGDGGDIEKETATKPPVAARITESTLRGASDPDEGTVQTFLRVDGMHSATCETFLESTATGLDGVTVADASYVSETVRIEYDPDEVSQETLADELSRVGYTAYPREAESEGGDQRGAGQTEPGISQERGLGDMLGFRYAAAVLFGAFLLIPYLTLFYPTYLSRTLDGAILSIFNRGIGLSGPNAIIVHQIYLVLTGFILVFAGLPLFRGAYVSLKSRQPDTNLLVAITVGSAYLYSAVAAVFGRFEVYFDLTIVVTAVVVAAIFYESLVKQQAMGRLTELAIARATEVTTYGEDGTTTSVPVEEMDPGDRVLVRAGERIPVDGVLWEGSCTVDESLVTGESLPVVKEAGDEVVGGSIVTDDAAVVSVREDASSQIDRIVTAVWELQSTTHGIHRRANQLASRIIPIIVSLGIFAAAGTVLLGGGADSALITFLLAVMVTCPWALGLATPLSVATSVKEALDRGIVIFDDTIFERLRDVDAVVFDKTGTLTTGEMDVIETDAPREILEAASQLEQLASHPAAAAIADRFDPRGNRENEQQVEGAPDNRPIGDVTGGPESFTSHTKGVEGVVDGTDMLVGHPDLFTERDWSVNTDLEEDVAHARNSGWLPILVGRDGVAEGLIVVGDDPRQGWDETFNRLSDRGIEVYVITGDDEEAADYFRSNANVEQVFAGVPPSGKKEAIRRLQSDKRVAMVGDGTNDAPALAQADLGISLGSGTALASDAADITIIDDEIAVVETTFDLARASRRRILQNNVLALLYNGIAIPLALTGLLNPLFAMTGVVVSGGLVAANSFRPLLKE
jgi:heavy metal translocating P-type ATPase